MSEDQNNSTAGQGLFEQGLSIRRLVMGKTYVDKAQNKDSTEFSQPGQELVTDWCWGYAWMRPGLEKRDRSLLNLGMLMALNRQPEFAAHVRGARRNGPSELVIREANIHATVYCGVPAGVDAFRTAESVFNEMAEKGEKPRELGRTVAGSK